MTRFDKPATGALGKLAATGNLRKIGTPTRETLAMVAGDYAAMRKSIAPLFEKIAKLERRVEEVEADTRPLPPAILRRHEPAPANDPNYVAVADLLEKAARAGLGREFDDAATILRQRSDSAQALAAASFSDIPNGSRP